jgi:hypothetical protein
MPTCWMQSELPTLDAIYPRYVVNLPVIPIECKSFAVIRRMAKKGIPFVFES